MRQAWRSTAVWLLLAFLTACAAAGRRADAQVAPTLYVYSTIDALLVGTYDGDLTVRELRTKGDFGIGTYNRLDGELIAVGGVFYHARADGSVVVAGPRERTPLAYITRFHPTKTLKAEAALPLSDLDKWVDGQVGNLSAFYAIRIDGEFREVTVRAIAAQSKPYKALAEVAKTQSVHEYLRTRGTLIGIRSPDFSKGISVPGYHWHFLTADRKHGGHALTLILIHGIVQVETISDLNLQLPKNESFAHADQSKDRGEETRQVEGK